MTWGLPATNHLSGTSPGEHQGADVHGQFWCFSKHPISTDEAGGACRHRAHVIGTLVPFSMESWKNCSPTNVTWPSKFPVDDVGKPRTGFHPGIPLLVPVQPHVPGRSKGLSLRRWGQFDSSHLGFNHKLKKKVDLACIIFFFKPQLSNWISVMQHLTRGH